MNAFDLAFYKSSKEIIERRGLLLKRKMEELDKKFEKEAELQRKGSDMWFDL